MAIFTIILLIALYGLFRPFKGIKRKYFAIAAVLSFILIGVTAPAPKPTKPVDPAVAAAEKEAATKAEAERVAESIMEDQRRNAARAVKAAIKASARNPDSVAFESVLTNENGSLVCMVYRAQNGFGGMNLEHLAVKNGKPYESTSFWNKNCANKELFEQSTW